MGTYSLQQLNPPSPDAGKPLEPGVRGAMEPFFGHDFSNIRVHATEDAARSAVAANASAFTIGRDMVFGAGRYEPETARGKRLIAHELTHAVQQDEVTASQPHVSADAAPRADDDGYEAEAEHAARRFGMGSTSVSSDVSAGSIPRPTLQRSPENGSALDLDGLSSTLPASAPSEQQDRPRTWAGRVDAAQQLKQMHSLTRSEDTRKAAEKAFASLLEESLGVRSDEVRIVRSKSGVYPGVINFDLTLDVHAETAGGLKGDPSTPWVAPTAITLGPRAFSRHSPEFTRMTYEHEKTHAAHAKAASELLSQWAKTAPPGVLFEDWLRSQKTAGKISQLDFDLAVEDLHDRYSHANSELLAHVAGFVSGYHKLPADLDSLLLFHDLIGMHEYWASAGKPAKSEVVERLTRFYRDGMDDTHRKRFDEFVDSQLSGRHEDTPLDLYRDLAKIRDRAPAPGESGQK